MWNFFPGRIFTATEETALPKPGRNEAFFAQSTSWSLEAGTFIFCSSPPLQSLWHQHSFLESTCLSIFYAYVPPLKVSSVCFSRIRRNIYFGLGTSPALPLHAVKFSLLFDTCLERPFFDNSKAYFFFWKNTYFIIFLDINVKEMFYIYYLAKRKNNSFHKKAGLYFSFKISFYFWKINLAKLSLISGD